MCFSCSTRRAVCLLVMFSLVCVGAFTFFQYPVPQVEATKISSGYFYKSLAWNAKAKQLTLGGIDGMVFSYYSETQSQSETRVGRSSIDSVAFSHDGSLVALAMDESQTVEATADSIRITRMPSTSKKRVQIWNSSLSTKIASLEWEDGFHSLVFSRDDKTLIGCGSTSIVVWNRDTWAHEVKRKGVALWLKCPPIIPTNGVPRLVTLGAGGELTEWSTRDLQPLNQLCVPENVTSMCCSDSERIAYTGDGNGTVSLVNFETGDRRVVARLGQGIQCMTTVPSGNLLIACESCEVCTPMLCLRKRTNNKIICVDPKSGEYSLLCEVPDGSVAGALYIGRSKVAVITRNPSTTQILGFTAVGSTLDGEGK